MNSQSTTDFQLNLKSLTDFQLLDNTKKCVKEERLMTSHVLHHLLEIENRMLHLKRGYSSMFAFCTKEYGYEESQAQRRISAMRLMREIPEIETKINSGALTLTAVIQAQTLFRHKAKARTPLVMSQKLEILKVLENKSTRECERELLKISPDVALGKVERSRPITEDLVELKLILKRETLEKLEKLKNLSAHKNMNMAELIDELVNKGLEAKGVPQNNATLHAAPKVEQTRYISAQTRCEIWARDRGECQYVDPLTRRKCQSQFKLEIDHIYPFALGGQHSRENLRLLCQAHNQFRAVQVFGEEKINKYKRY